MKSFNFFLGVLFTVALLTGVQIAGYDVNGNVEFISMVVGGLVVSNF